MKLYFHPSPPVHLRNLNLKLKFKKINLNFYFHTSLWCLKKFYEGLKGLHKTFWGTTNKGENKNLSYFFLFVRDPDDED